MAMSLTLAADIVSGTLIGVGVIFVLIGTLGLLRLPDFYTRLHAAGVTDTLGAELMLVGMMVQAGFSLITIKLFLIALFIFFTSPTATHAVANAARVTGLVPHLVPPADLENFTAPQSHAPKNPAKESPAPKSHAKTKLAKTKLAQAGPGQAEPGR